MRIIATPCPRSIHLAVQVNGQPRPNLLYPLWDKRSRVAFTRTIRSNIQTIGRQAA